MAESGTETPKRFHRVPSRGPRWNLFGGGNQKVPPGPRSPKRSHRGLGWEMPNDELGYLAGVFDGEGTFGIWSKGKNKTRQLRVAVDMSVGDTVLRFLTFFKEGAIYSRQPKDPKHRLMYSWRVTNKEKAFPNGFG